MYVLTVSADKLSNYLIIRMDRKIIKIWLNTANTWRKFLMVSRRHVLYSKIQVKKRRDFISKELCAQGFINIKVKMSFLSQDKRDETTEKLFLRWCWVMSEFIARGWKNIQRASFFGEYWSFLLRIRQSYEYKFLNYHVYAHVWNRMIMARAGGRR